MLFEYDSIVLSGRRGEGGSRNPGFSRTSFVNGPKRLGFCRIDLDFHKAQYFTNCRGRARGRGRVVVGLDTGPRRVVIDRGFTSTSCMC